MPTESMVTNDRVILVEGDPVLGMDAIVGIKQGLLASGMSPDSWIEVCPADKKAKAIGEFLNALDGELSLADWDGGRKCILLRGLQDNKQFSDAIIKVIHGISPSNTLIVFDEDGVMRSSRNPNWRMFRERIEKLGTVKAMPVPFAKLDDGFQTTNRVKAVVDEVAKRGKKISPQTVREIFLEKVVHEWSYVLSEIEKLVDLSEGQSITPKEVDEIVFPSAPNHAIFEFAKAFDSGSFDETMDCYDNLVASKPNDSKPAEGIVAYAMKLVRWQLVASHLYSYGQSLPNTLIAIAARMNLENGRRNTSRDRLLHPHWFHKEKESAKQKELDERLAKSCDLTPFQASGTSAFVKNVFSRRMPVSSGDLGRLPFNQVAMLRYMAVFECMHKIRFAQDKQAARQAFRQAIYKTCWRG